MDWRYTNFTGLRSPKPCKIVRGVQNGIQILQDNLERRGYERNAAGAKMIVVAPASIEFHSLVPYQGGPFARVMLR